MAKEALMAREVQAEDLVAQATDTGGREIRLDWQGKLILGSIAFIWAFYQLYIASNLPFFLTDLMDRHQSRL